MSAVCYNCFQTKPSGGVCPFCGHDPAKEKSYPLALTQGSILNGRYIVGRVIGQGGFGITYIAQDYQTKERVWWLRSLRSVEGYEGQIYDFTNIGHRNAAIDYDGSVQKNKFGVDSDYIAVRPVVWIDITGMADKYFIQAEEERKAAEFAASLQTVGKTVIFGHYEQDNDLTNGKEPIEWIVLDTQDGKSLLLSKYALDCQPYNTNKQNVTWSTCSLRTWLNGGAWGYGFISVAFSSEEQARIPIVIVAADQNPKYDTSTGDNVSDNGLL